MNGIRNTKQDLLNDPRIQKMVSKLQSIKDRQWTEDNSNSGPIDCTPKEKGLLKYAGQTNLDANEALEGFEELKTEIQAGDEK